MDDVHFCTPFYCVLALRHVYVLEPIAYFLLSTKFYFVCVSFVVYMVSRRVMRTSQIVRRGGMSHAVACEASRWRMCTVLRAVC